MSERRLRAPESHGAALFEPALREAPRLARSNRELLRGAASDDAGAGSQTPLGRALRERGAWSRAAREELLAAALRHTRAYRDYGGVSGAENGLLLAGHQPQLFHPGVWVKNFALAQLAEQQRAAAVNLIIDNDLAASPSIRIPVGEPSLSSGELPLRNVRWETAAYDASSEPVPGEERRVLDGERFDAFGERVARWIRPLSPTPLIRRLWGHARAARRRGAALPQCLAEARHALEGELGLATLEAPISRICGGPSFCRFVALLLRSADGFLAIHNRALSDFRRVHRVRSRSHPVPALETDATWIETPLWVWRSTSPRRGRLFVRPDGAGLQLSDRANWRATLGADAAADLQQLQREGVRIRPRALATTLYARLLLSDLFVHGIGGANYDQLTDAIVGELTGAPPPAFLTATATATLAEAAPARTRAAIRGVERELRDLRFNPQRRIASAAPDSIAEAVASRRRWIADTSDLARRHREIAQRNAQLEEHLRPLRATLLERRAELARRLSDELKLGSRELAFCLFDEEKLPALLLEVCRDSS